MNKILFIALIFVSQSAMADGPCTSLSNYVGTYKQVSKTCDDYFHILGPKLEVTPYNESSYSGYWINTENMDGMTTGYGPTTSDNVGDIDKCTVNGNNVLVQISENDQTGIYLPHKGRFSYIFSPTSVAFTADGCTATYVRE